MGTTWLAVLCTAIGCIGMMVNILAFIILLSFVRRTKAAWIKYLINQSIIDFCSSVMLILSNFNLAAGYGIETYYIKNHIAYEMLCVLWKSDMFLFFCVDASTYNLVIVTLDRYVKIIHPLWYSRHVTVTKQKCVIVVPWVLAFITEGVLYYNITSISDNVADSVTEGVLYSNTTGVGVGDTSGQCNIGFEDREEGKIRTYLYTVLTYIIPMLTMTFCYVHMLVKVHKRIKDSKEDFAVTNDNSLSTEIYESEEQGGMNTDVNMTVLSTDNADKTSSVQQSKYSENPGQSKKGNLAERHLIEMLIVVSIGFFCCFTLLHVMIIIINSIGNYGNETLFWRLYQAGLTLVCCNCVITPVLYVIKHRKLRGAATKICACNK